MTTYWFDHKHAAVFNFLGYSSSFTCWLDSGYRMWDYGGGKYLVFLFAVFWGLGFGVSWVASIMCVVAIDVALGIVTTPSKTTAGDIPFCGSVSLFSCSRHTQPTVLLTSIIPSINFMYCLHFTHLPLLLFVYSCDYSIHACCLYCRCQRAHPITAKVSTKPAMHLRYEI